MDRLRAIDSVQGGVQTVGQHNAAEVGGEPFLDLGPAIVIKLASQIWVKGANHIAVRVRNVLSSFGLVDEIVSS